MMSAILRSLGFAVAAFASIASLPAAAASVPPGYLYSVDAVKAPEGARAWRVRYASEGMLGETIVVSGIVIAPLGTPPRSGRPVVAWSHGAIGIAPSCAPSKQPWIYDSIPDLAGLVKRGYVVTATDYPGFGTSDVHPLLVGILEARSSIDAVRAARRIPAAAAGTRFAAWGESQGGHSSLFTGQIAHDYAPELSLVGVAAIVPPTDLADIVEHHLDSDTGKILSSWTLYSWSITYGVPLDLAAPKASLARIKRIAGICYVDKLGILRLGLTNALLGGSFLDDRALSNDRWAPLFVKNTPGQQPPGAPLFIAQGTDDEVVPERFTTRFVAMLCKRGDTVQYDIVPGLGHIPAGHETSDAATAWIFDRFEGKTPPNTCATR